MNNLINTISFRKIFLLGFLVGAGLFTCQQASAADVAISVRYQDNLLYTGSIALPAPGTISLLDTDGVSRNVNAQSVLAVLARVDDFTSDFDISRLQYFSSFSSLYLKCVVIAKPETEACDNWQYVVNDAAPFVGMDAYALAGGETVYVYFGNSRQVVLNNSSVPAGGSLTATAQRYRYQDNTWTTLSGVTLGVKSGNTVIMQSAVNSEGVANFTLNTSPGDYAVGIAEDFYFPSFGLSVYASSGPISAETFQEPQEEEIPKFDAERAVQFLADNQLSDGSIGSSLVSDWAAIALGAFGEATEAKEKLKEYLISNPDPGTLLTDYERRAMALMALGVNPYSGTSINYIEKIISSFDGSQFGDPAFFNDDTFALLALLKAGFSSEDEIIRNTLGYVLSHQQADGSFAGSVDMTAAIAQVLTLLPEEQGARDAIAEAALFLADNQQTDGGFGNVFSTAWAIQAIEAMDNPKFSWRKNGKGPVDFLASLQQEDGTLRGVSSESMTWANSVAIPSVLLKPWGIVLQNFQKPEILLSLVEELPLKHIDLAVIQTKLDRIKKEAKAIQQEIIALRNAQNAYQQFATVEGNPALSDLRIFAPDRKEEQAFFKKFGAEVLLAKESLDIVALSLAVIGLGLALALAGGMPNAGTFAKIARIFARKISARP